MHPLRPMRRYSETGFSLIEIMVGIAIGMFAIIVMLQTFSLFEGRKRTTTSGSDAMSEGVMALYALQRDIRQAGYGLSALDILGCPVTISGVSIDLAPVTINPPTAIVPRTGIDANTDTLLVIYGNSEGQPQGVAYVANTVNPTPDNHYVVIDSPCTAAPISSGETSRAVAGTFYDLGPSPKILAYAVRSGNLTMCDYLARDCSDAANYAPIANNIVSLRAQYGHDTATPNPLPAGSTPGVPDPQTGIIPAYRVDSYDQTQAQDLPLGATAACKWARTGAIRLALVARSTLFEKDLVTTAAPVWDGSDGAPIDLSANDDWGYYRYKVFQTVVPLRNVTWMGVQEGC